jgi:hydrogenase accessory protein HypB
VERVNLKIGKLAAVVPTACDSASTSFPKTRRWRAQSSSSRKHRWSPAAKTAVRAGPSQSRCSPATPAERRSRDSFRRELDIVSIEIAQEDDMKTVNDKRRTREIKVVERVLNVNERMAEQNRRRFAEKGVFVINVMSSPGSGKTATLQKTLERIMPEIKAAVIVGDVSTTQDAERLSVTGAPVVQVNTDAFGGDCHLAAHVIEKAADEIDLDAITLLIIENVGNLVCPAEFDIGEDARVVVLSVTEGEDKPVKYPTTASAVRCGPAEQDRPAPSPGLREGQGPRLHSPGAPGHAGVRDVRPHRRGA